MADYTRLQGCKPLISAAYTAALPREVDGPMPTFLHPLPRWVQPPRSFSNGDLHAAQEDGRVLVCDLDIWIADACLALKS